MSRIKGNLVIGTPDENWIEMLDQDPGYHEFLSKLNNDFSTPLNGDDAGAQLEESSNEARRSIPK